METYTTTFGNSVADALPSERAAFIRRTYAHLAGAVLLFILLETYLVVSGAGLWMAQTMLGGRYSWLIVLGAFMGVSWLANWWATSQTSRPLQYMGLMLYVVAETILFLPLLFLAAVKSGGGEIIIQCPNTPGTANETKIRRYRTGFYIDRYRRQNGQTE